jgi:hypothetical protein
MGLARDAQGNIYFPDAGAMYKLSADFATVTNLGSHGNATDVAVLANGTILLSRSYSTICRYDSPTMCTTVAGIPGSSGFAGDGGPATSALLNDAERIAAHPTDPNIYYIADAGNRRIRMVNNGIITTVAGNGTRGFSGDGGPATSAMMLPRDVAVDSAGNLFIADLADYRIRWGAEGQAGTTLPSQPWEGCPCAKLPAPGSQLASGNRCRIHAARAPL